MVATSHQVLIFVTIVALLSCNVRANNSRPPRTHDNANLAEALKYLKDLDNYYGDLSRSRYGKRDAAMKLLKNNFNNEAEMTHGYDLSAAEEPF